VQLSDIRQLPTITIDQEELSNIHQAEEEEGGQTKGIEEVGIEKIGIQLQAFLYSDG
jgi:hypothetical protein